MASFGALSVIEESDTLVSDKFGSVVIAESNDTVLSDKFGVVDFTESNDTLISDKFGSVNLSEANDILSTSTLISDKYGILDIIESNDTIISDKFGVVDHALDHDVGILLGNLALTGTAILAEADDTAVSVNTLAITGALTSTLESDQTLIETEYLDEGYSYVRVNGKRLRFNNSFLTYGAKIASLIITEANDTTSAQGNLAIRGQVSYTEGNDSGTGTAEQEVKGSLNYVEANDQMLPPRFGSATLLLADDTSVAASKLNITGYLNGVRELTFRDGVVTINAKTLSMVDPYQVEQSDTFVGSGSVAIRADSDSNEFNDTLVAQATIRIVATAELNETNDGLSSESKLLITGNVSNEISDTILSRGGKTDYLVNLNDLIISSNPATINNMIEALESIGAKNLQSLNSIGVISAEVDPLLVANIPNITVESNVFFSIQTTQTLFDDDNWGLDRIDSSSLPLNQKYRYTRQAPNVDVYVLDTGININHNEFGYKNGQQRAKRLYDYREDLPVGHKDRILPNSAGYAVDNNGHGTLVASIIGGVKYGVAKQVDLKSVKIFDKQGLTNTWRLLQGLNAVLEDHQTKPSPASNGFRPSVVNMSFSTTSGSESTALVSVVGYMMNQGIIFVSSSGNNSSAIAKYDQNVPGVQVPTVLPGSINNMLTVGAIDRNDAFLLAYRDPISGQTHLGSNYGPGVDLYAPGYALKGAWKSEFKDPKGATAEGSGSSIAAAFVSGIVALYLERAPTMWVEDPNSILQPSVRDFIRNSASTSGIKGLPDQSNDKILRSIFVPGDLQWITPPGLLVTVQEDQPLLFQLRAKNLDTSQRAMRIEYRFANFSEQQDLSVAGFALTGEGQLYGTATTVNPNDQRYVSVKDLPEDQQGIFAPDIRGYIDYTFEGLITDPLTSLPQAFYGGQTRSFTIRVLDKNVSPVWHSDSPIIHLNDYGAFSVGDTVSIDFTTFVAASVDDPDNDALEFTFLVGELPKGLTLSNDGLLSGELEIFTNGESIYSKNHSFIVRATDGHYVVDQQFDLIVSRTSATNNPPEWNYTTIPQDGPVITARQGQGLYVRLEAFDPDGDPLIYSTSTAVGAPPTNIPGESGYDDQLPHVYHDLPGGITINEEGVLLGVVHIEADTALYYCTVSVSDGFETVNALLRIDVDDKIGNSQFIPIPTIQWQTPAGLLGSLDETYPSYLSVRATSDSPKPIQYELADSTVLPGGLSLDPYTGDITGVAHYLTETEDTQFDFRVRAFLVASPGAFVVRDFSIKIRRRFAAPICAIGYSLAREQRQEIVDFINNPMILKNIGPDQIFRPDDTNFGVQREPQLLVMGGFPKLTPQQVYDRIKDDLPNTDPSTWNRSNTTPVSNFHRNTFGILGDLKVAAARNIDGSLAYWVLYMEIYDPSYRSGGFDDDGNYVPIPYVQENPSDPISPKNIFPSSIRNWRFDLKQEGDLLGEERLPLWMTSQQIIGDDSSIIGYIPALELMYLQPDASISTLKSALRMAKYNKLLRNKPLQVDRYVWQDMQDVNNIRKRFFKFLPGNLN